MGDSLSHTLEECNYDDIDIDDNIIYHYMNDSIEEEFEEEKILHLVVVAHNKEMRKQRKSISIKCTSTIGELKEKIGLQFGIEINSFYLSIPNLKPLYRDELRLTDYNILNGEILSIQYMSNIDHMIAVYYNNKKLELNNLVKTYNTVFELKTVIEELQSIPIQCQTLYLRDNDGQKVSLYDDEVISNYYVDTAVYFRESTIYLEVDVIDDNLLSLVQSIDFRAMDDECCRIYDQCSDIQIINMYKIEKNVKQNLLIYNNVLNTMQNKREKILFHGTSLANIEEIILNGFNRDYNKRSAYGKGTYFAKYAKTAANYSRKDEKSGLYAMLVSKVIIGDYGLYKSDGMEQFDSLVNHLNNPSIFVINRDYHAVPLYIILFKKRYSKQYKTQQRTTSNTTKRNNRQQTPLYTQQRWIKSHGITS